MSDMGSVRTVVEIANPSAPAERRLLANVLVDTGAELSWFPRAVLEELGIRPIKIWHFRQANGTVLERWTGGAWVHVVGTMTLDEVVFGEPGDLRHSVHMRHFATRRGERMTLVRPDGRELFRVPSRKL